MADNRVSRTLAIPSRGGTSSGNRIYNWHDPGGLGADLGTILGTRCSLTSDHLGVYVEAQDAMVAR
jgi:hypothetical protein